MNHLDLFSGIGGFALATEVVWPDVTHTFVELDSFCTAVLRKHWPKATFHDDIKTYRGGSESVDLVTGGFPCQPFSLAGKRKGTDDDRDLWPEMFRVICEAKPRWVIGENVAGFIQMELERSVADLESAGYEVQAFVIPAAAVGAPHRRDRVWIVAHSNTRRIRRYERESLEKGSTALGDSPRAVDSNTNIKRLQGRTGTEINKRSKSVFNPSRHSRRGHNWEENWTQVATRLCRMDDGLPKRVDRLKALGNAIVPQVAAEIMMYIKAVDESI